MFPDAPIHTLLHVRGSLDPELERRDIRTTFVQGLPGVARHYRSYLPLFPAAAATIDVSGYDLVISSSHCVAKGVKRAPRRAARLLLPHADALRVGPLRRLLRRRPAGAAGPPVIALAAHRLRAWDVATAPRVDHFAANSNYVAARIRRYYGRPSTVIPPPVDTDFFTPGPETAGTYDLVVSALVPYKRIGLVLDAYRGSAMPLRIVGTGPEGDRLRARAGPEVAFLGHVDDASLRDLYRGCRAVIMPNVEDFGITAVEAMACGRPVVVFAEGGGAESVIDGETGDRLPRSHARRRSGPPLTRFRPCVLIPPRSGHAPKSFSRRRFESRFRAFLDAARAENAA